MALQMSSRLYLCCLCSTRDLTSRSCGETASAPTRGMKPSPWALRMMANSLLIGIPSSEWSRLGCGSLSKVLWASVGGASDAETCCDSLVGRKEKGACLSPFVWETATNSERLSCACSLLLFLLDLLPCNLAIAGAARGAGLNREGLAGMLVKPSAWSGPTVRSRGNCDSGAAGEGVGVMCGSKGSPVPESPAPKVRLAGRSDTSHVAIPPGLFATALIAFVWGDMGGVKVKLPTGTLLLLLPQP